MKQNTTPAPIGYIYCAVNIVIGNGTGHHSFTAGKGYSLKSLQADARLTAAQIRKYFRATWAETKAARTR